MNMSQTAKNNIAVWLVVFLYAAIASILVQFVILPYFLPGVHWGHGLLAGLDSTSFHKLAVSLAEKIAQEGWGSWKLRPGQGGQAPAGIAAILYRLAWPEPWTMIPVNAAVHATTAVMAVLIVRQFAKGWLVAALAAAPLVFFPSSLTWVSQLHKDGFTILGAFFVMYSVSQVVRKGDRWGQAACLTFYLLLGSFFIWLMRPYLVSVVMLPVIAVLAPAMITLQQIALKLSGQPIASFKQLFIKATALTVMLIIMNSFPSSGGGVKFRPKTAEGKCGAVIDIRNNFISSKPDAGSAIDADIELDGCADLLAYVPRALTIGLLAPFPAEWFRDGSSASNTYMRRVSALEMTIVYFALAFAPLFAWRYRMRFDMWFIAAFSIVMLLILAIVVPNVGTLYRMRYGYLLLLTAFGVAEAHMRFNPAKPDR
jgi:hypothetical protein